MIKLHIYHTLKINKTEHIGHLLIVDFVLYMFL